MGVGGGSGGGGGGGGSGRVVATAVTVVVVRQKMGVDGGRVEKNAKAPARTALRRGTIRGDECLLYLSVTGVP